MDSNEGRPAIHHAAEQRKQSGSSGPPLAITRGTGSPSNPLAIQ